MLWGSEGETGVCQAAVSPPAPPGRWQVLQPASFGCGPPGCMIRPLGMVASKLMLSWQAPQARLDGLLSQLSASGAGDR